MDKNKNIETLFKDNFTDYSAKPSSGVWTTISRKIWLQSLLRLKNFLILFGGLSLVAILIYTNQNHSKTEHNATPTKITETTAKNTSKENTIQTSANENTQVEPVKDRKKEHIIIVSDNHKTNTQKATDKAETQIDINIPTPINTELSSGEETKTLLPQAQFSVSVQEGCAPLTVHFMNNSKYTDSFIWSFGNGDQSYEKNPSALFTSDGEFKVTLTCSKNGLVSKVHKTIVVHPKPDSEIMISDPNNIYAGENVQFVNIGSSGYQYIWNFGDNSKSTEKTPEHRFQKKGIYNIKLICETMHGCADTAMLYNLVVKNRKYNIIFPDAFTPNMSGTTDGLWNKNDVGNDIFHPITTTDVTQYRLRVYSKAGVLLFESSDLQVGWNGYYNNRLLPAAVYVYRCSGQFSDGEHFQKMGNVTLLHTNY